MSFRKTTEQFIIKANEVHYNKYNYSLVNYVDNSTKVKIICNDHGIFEQQPNNHINGQGCKLCKKKFITNIDEFLAFAGKIEYHKDKYDYSMVNFINNKTKIKIKCLICGDIFEQFPPLHLRGNGCFNCAINRSAKDRTKSIEQFIIDARKIHGDKYDYSKVEYINSNTKVLIICNNCNLEWYQLPNNHLKGRGCNSCALQRSKPEKEWLDVLNIPIECRQKTIKYDNIKYTVDALISETNTVYEFYGDFWHGNPNKYDQNNINKKTGTTFGSLYDKTINKENNIKKLGYNIISIWDSDWKALNGKKYK